MFGAGKKTYQASHKAVVGSVSILLGDALAVHRTAERWRTSRCRHLGLPAEVIPEELRVSLADDTAPWSKEDVGRWLRRVGGCVDGGRKEKINKSNTSRSSKEIDGRCSQGELSPLNEGKCIGSCRPVEVKTVEVLRVEEGTGVEEEGREVVVTNFQPELVESREGEQESVLDCEEVRRKGIERDSMF